MAIGLWYAFRPELLFVNETVNESFPAGAQTTVASEMKSEPELLADGMFHSNAHETKGKATIYQLADEKRILRFTEFETSNGPDVNIYLVAAPAVKDDATVKEAGFITLGPIKGNKGDQNYELPSDVDLGTYQAITVWCKRFSVNFGTAPLTLATP